MCVNGEVVASKGPGESFGEMALLSNETRSADVIAMQLCELATLQREDCMLRMVIGVEREMAASEVHL